MLNETRNLCASPLMRVDLDLEHGNRQLIYICVDGGIYAHGCQRPSYYTAGEQKELLVVSKRGSRDLGILGDEGALNVPVLP